METNCNFIEGCPMFKYFSESAEIIYAYFYCKDAYLSCERYKRRMKGEDVPPCLLPQGYHLWDPEKEKPPKEFTLS